ncbi:MAG: LamG domain-containing protein, partial [Myxococcota bacterium]|nr:LamG domain-containing protein [Myxococcota bacterium]
YRFEWLLDGSLSGFTEALLPASATEPDDYWTCLVTPSDGLDDGPPAAASVLIGFEEKLADPPEPLLHYTFDGHLLDVTGNGYDGIGYGNLSYIDGALSQGLALDGDSSWVDTGFALNLGDFTASVWINNALSPSHKGPIVDRFPDWRLANEDGNVDEAWLSGQGLEASAFDSWSTGGPRYGVGYETASQGQWVHLVLVYDGLEMLLYVDGSLVDSTGAPGRSETPGTIWLGRKHLATAEYLEGALDDFILWDEALSPGEIAGLLDGL